MNQGERAVDRVEETLDRLTEPEHPRKYATTDAPARGERLVAEQQRETGDFGLMGTDGQRKGLIAGSVVGGAIGAIVLLPFGFLSWGADVSPALRFITCAVIGIIAGSVVGAVYWGGRVPELEGETVTADNEPGSGTSMADPRTDDRGRPTGER